MASGIIKKIGNYFGAFDAGSVIDLLRMAEKGLSATSYYYTLSGEPSGLSNWHRVMLLCKGNEADCGELNAFCYVILLYPNATYIGHYNTSTDSIDWTKLAYVQ